MTENQVAKLVVDAAFCIHVRLGPGLLESVYHDIMVYELRKRGLSVVGRVPVPVVWDDLKFQKGYQADIIVEGLVIVELKSVETIQSVHMKQLLTYLRLSDMRLGLMINFGSELIKDGITRVVNGLRES